MFVLRNPVLPRLSFRFVLIIFLVALMLTGITCLQAAASAWYVKPSSEVPIRSGQGTGYKILAVVPDGLQVEILEEEEPWAKVRTAGGTEGWMLKRYLSETPPLSQKVALLEGKNTRLAEQADEANRKLVDVSAAHTELEKEFDICIAERDEIGKTYETLRNDTADVMKIKQNLAARSQENQELVKKLATVEQENSDLKRNTALMWFLAGGGLLLIGWIIGMMSGKSRKRKSSLL